MSPVSPNPAQIQHICSSGPVTLGHLLEQLFGSKCLNLVDFRKSTFPQNRPFDILINDDKQ